MSSFQLTQCGLCSLIGPRPALVQHIKRDHPQPLPPTLGCAVCRECGRDFDDLAAHMREFHPIRTHETGYVCGYGDCMYAFGASNRIARFARSRSMTTVPSRICGHVTRKHISTVPQCVAPWCRRNVLRYGLRNHVARAHPNMYVCPLGQQCTLGAHCRSALQHVAWFELHNAMVAKTPSAPPPWIDVSDLLLTTHAYPSAEIAHRIAVARAEFEAEHAPSPDSPHSGENLPTEMWILIASFVDDDTLFGLTRVSKRLRHVAYHVAHHQRPYESFRYNVVQLINRGDACGMDDRDELAKLPALKPTDRIQIHDFRLQFLAPTSLLTGRTFSFAFTVDYLCRQLYDKHGQSWRTCRDTTAAKRAIHNRKVEERRIRQTELTRALAARGVDLRADSSMCKRYIATGRGMNGETLDEIVEIMDEMAWMYATDTYLGFVEEVKGEYRDDDDEWYESYLDIVDEAKDRTVENWYANTDRNESTLPLLPARVMARLRRLVPAPTSLQ